MANSILLYGVTGSFKTANAAEYVKFLRDAYGGVTRAIFGDNIGPCRELVRDGLIDAWDITQMPNPLACVILASQGYWPERLENGKPVGDRLIKDNFDGVSGYLIEGFKENADLFMRMLERDRQATGEPLVGEHSTTYGNVVVNYAVSSRGTYQFAQTQTHRYFKLGFKGLPVPWVMATSHEYAKKKEGIYGVAVAGSALAKVAPQWFDHCLHFEKVTTETTIRDAANKLVKVPRDGSRAWFTGHQIENIRWQAKLGVEPWMLAHIYKTWPMGYVPLVMSGSGEEWKYDSSIRNLLEVIDPAPAVDNPAENEGNAGAL